MSVAIDIMNAVKTIVETALPPRKVFVRRDSEMNPAFWADMTPPCFAVTCNGSCRTDMAWKGKKFVVYPVILTYYTPELPGQRDESADVRNTLEAAARLFLKPGMAGAVLVNDVNLEPQRPYTLPLGTKVVNCTPLRLFVETIEDAN